MSTYQQRIYHLERDNSTLRSKLKTTKAKLHAAEVSVRREVSAKDDVNRAKATLLRERNELVANERTHLEREADLSTKLLETESRLNEADIVVQQHSGVIATLVRRLVGMSQVGAAECNVR